MPQPAQSNLSCDKFKDCDKKADLPEGIDEYGGLVSTECVAATLEQNVRLVSVETDGAVLDEIMR